MHSPSRSLSHRRRRFKVVSVLPALFLLVAALLAITLRATHVAEAAQSDPVLNAWERARAAGSYHFSSELVQVTLPSSTVSNVGRTSRTDELFLDGENDTRAERLEFNLLSQGGSLLQAGSRLGVRVEDGKTWVRQGEGEWQESDNNFTEGIAPGGDFMAYLTAIRDVTAHEPEERAGIKYTRYTFGIDGPSFALYVRDQMAEALRANGELPPNTPLEVPTYYRDMTGEGEVWIGADGLPLRQILTLRFPEQNEETVHAQITVDFSEFGAPPLALGEILRSGDLSALGELTGAALSARLPSVAPLLIMLMAATCAALLVRFRRERTLEHSISIALVVCIVLGPLLSNQRLTSFMQAQAARAASQEEANGESERERTLAALERPPFNPQVDPVAEGEAQFAAATRLQTVAPELGVAGAANALFPTDDGTDTDGDGLSNFVEERVGTDWELTDTDGDGLSDGLEVNGFDWAGKHWYLDPHSVDSNDDGRPDTLEYDANRDNQPDDMDNDGIPDVLDSDNDNDGVPDSKDIAPLTKVSGSGAFNEGAPFKLAINNLQAGQPTLVDFQIRPTNADHLWYAFNVLDWPQDSLGQVQDVDQATFADVGTVQGGTHAANDASGDMKLIPMLEVRVPNGANLPPQSDLLPYSVSIQELDGSGTKVAYVPLSLVNDEETGQRVAFNARMRYLPTSGSWGSPNEVRLVWVVQALQDVPCDPANATDVAKGCQPDGYIHNVTQVIHTYYDDWTLAGLSVSEEHGTSVGIVYEDPAVDNDLKTDDALTLLSHGLDLTFLGARDENNDGTRDVTVGEIARRFDHSTNGAVTTDERWDISNILSVKQNSYATFDQAMIYTAMTDTKQVLASAFTSPWQADNTLQPLIMYAYETNARALALDSQVGGGGYVTLNSDGVTLDMLPGGQSAVPITTIAGMRWTPYCAPNAASPLWKECDADTYWNTISARYANASRFLSDPDTPTYNQGRLVVNQLYVQTLMRGVTQVVQNGNQLVSARYSLVTDSSIASTMRTVGTIAQSAIAFVANTVLMARYLFEGSVLKFLSAMIGDALTSVKDLAKDYASLFKAATREGSVAKPIAGTAIALAATALIVTLIVLSAKWDLAAQITLKVVVIAITTVLTVVSPIATLVQFAEVTGASISSLLSGSTKVIGVSAGGTLIGAIIGVAVAWGFFIYSMVANRVSAFSPEFNKALAETIATAIYLIILAAISATVIGLIIVAIVGVIDAILTAICELGVDELRNVPGLGGACFTIGNALIKLIAFHLYNFQPMVNTERPDLVVTGSPDVTLSNPNLGYAVGNQLNVALPITSTVVHADPDLSNGYMILPYMWLYSKSNLRTSTLRYSLTQPNKETLNVGRSQMTNEWQNLVEDHKWAASPMYRAQAPSPHGPLTNVPMAQAGINRTFPFYLNMAYALPAYECWLIPPPLVFYPIPVCYVRSISGASSTEVDQIRFDVFPATLDGFMTVETRNANVSLAWDRAFPSLIDADGDGLRAYVQNGMDPNDLKPDADNDGLTDAFELDRRAEGVNLSPITSDGDLDGLTDRQEIQLGTNPAVADTDNDGLNDGEEVWHQMVDTVTGQPTSTWTGGWEVTINAATPFAIRVSSDPLQRDSDGDGLTDLVERTLSMNANPANRIDDENRPYHPNIFNSSPIKMYLAVSDSDSIVRPGQSFVYTSTVVANTRVRPGTLQVAVPGTLGTSPTPYVLPFDVNATAPQTVTQSTPLTAQWSASSQEVTLNSDVYVGLPGNGINWNFTAVQQPTLGGFASPTEARATNLTPTDATRGDSYLLAAMTSSANSELGQGAIRGYELQGNGANREWESAGVSSNQYFLRGTAAPAIATLGDGSGQSLVAWDRVDRCNTVTVNRIKVVSQRDHGTPGIEPFIRLDYTEQGRSEVAWKWFDWVPNDWFMNNFQIGLNDPNPNGPPFPMTRTFCGTTNLEMRESDGNIDDLGSSELVGTLALDPAMGFSQRTLTFENSNQKIELDVVVGTPNQWTIGAQIVDASGAVITNVSIPQDANTQARNPVVASNGAGWVVVYEQVPTTPPFLVPPFFFNIYGIAFGDGDTTLRVVFISRQGQASHASSLSLGAMGFGNYRRTSTDIAWMGDRYRLAWKLLNGTQIWTREIRHDGGDLGGNTVELATNATPENSTTFNNSGVDFTPHLAYDPNTGRWVLAYVSGDSWLMGLKLYNSVTETTASETMEHGPNGVDAVDIAYDPVRRAWLAAPSHLVAGNGQHQFMQFPPHTIISGIGFVTAQRQTQEAGGALSCPANVSAASTELMFEDDPGSTSFADTSGLGHNATTASASTAPSAGMPGAPGAPASTFGVRFDGVDDYVDTNWTTPNDFTIAFWMKATNPTGIQTVLDAGGIHDIGFALYLDNGIPIMKGFNNIGVSSQRLDDGQWHLLTITRNKSGGMTMWVDGNQVASMNQSGGVLTASTLRVGRSLLGANPFVGSLDHLQIFPIDLGASGVQAIKERTLNSYCVAAYPQSAASGGPAINWYKVQASRIIDTGGAIGANAALALTIDADAPTSSLTSLQNGANVQGNTTLIIGGEANDPTSSIDFVEVSVNNGAWQRANGAATWTFPLQVTEGTYTLSTRATDVAGNVQTPGVAVTITADATAPAVTLNTPSATPVVPTRNASNQWIAPLSGTASDPSGIPAGAIEVHLTAQSGVGPVNTWQPATLNGTDWTLDYAFPPDMGDPTGTYTVTVRAADNVGNRTADNAATGTLALDSAGPIASLSADDAARQGIGAAVQLSGLVTDTNSTAGLDTLEIAFTPISQVGTLTDTIISEDAETQLNRTWHPVTLAQRGAGVASSAWTITVPGGLEDLYQIDLRGTDLLGNKQISANVWRGPIDTLAPRVTIASSATGANYFDFALMQQLYEVRFTCAVTDLYLNNDSFTCGGNAKREPAPGFYNDPILSSLFPDLTVLNGLANSWTEWRASTTPSAAASACDTFNNCATESVGSAGTNAADAAQREASLAAAGEPTAVIVSPVAGETIAATDSVKVTVAAEAGQSLQQVVLKLDGTVVSTLTFTQTAAITRTQQTITVPVTGEGAHTLEVSALDWAGGTQSTPFTSQFTLDSADPTVTLDSSPLTMADTYGPGSDMLRFSGTATDAVGLASVLIKVNDGPFADVTFNNGTWHTAIPVSDMGDQLVAVTVRAIDFSGRVAEASNNVTTNLSSGTPPETSITAQPNDPSDVNPVVFSFEGTAGSEEVASFECRMDAAPFALCTSPASYADLSVGSHTFAVRAVDATGNVDPTPASYTWTVNPIGPQTTLTAQPMDNSTSRNATFSWEGAAGAVSFECKLDDGAYSACDSPKSYSNLDYGSHTFTVRALTAANNPGTPTSYTWRIVNAAPVADNQSLEVQSGRHATITLSATDNEPLIFSIVESPAHGALHGTAPNVTYVPDANFEGTDTFTFRASDGQNRSNVATVTVNTIPTAVTLAGFWAQGLSNAVQVGWETTFEEGTLGFNLYRSTSPDGERQLLNGDLIPSQSPGGGSGGAYEWLDEAVEANVTYFYWLEDLSQDGSTALYGPVSASVAVPTAVTLDVISTRPGAPTAPLALLLLLGLGVCLVRRAASRKKEV